MKSIIKRLLSAGDTNFLESIGILFLRAYLGLAMLIAHGLPKIEKGPAALPNPFEINPTFNGILIIFAEVVCAALIAIGLGTRIASFVLAICMFVACFIFHGDHGFAKMELAFVYLMGYLALIFIGAGKFSLDKVFGAKAKA